MLTPSTDDILIHTFITPGFMGWAELFLQSLRRQHGEIIRVRLDGRNLLDADVALLESTYSNIEIHNAEMPLEKVAAALGIGIETLHQYARGVERGELSAENIAYKIYVSVNERYRSLEGVMDKARADGFRMVLHSDADIYIRRPLTPMFDIMSDHDLSIYIRKGRPANVAVVGGFLGFNLTEGMARFTRRWMDAIDATPFSERQKGFGQAVIWSTIQQSEDVDIADLNAEPDALRMSKTFDPDSDLWLGNAKTAGPTKVVSIRECWGDLSGIEPRIPLPRISLGERVVAFGRSLTDAIRSAVSR